MRSALALIVLLAGCADPPADAPTLTVRALYLGPMYEGQAMNADHEAIPERMPAMRMPFRVVDPAVLEGLAEGGPVRLTLDSASLAVVAVEPLPAGTPLDLEDIDDREVTILPDDS